MIIRFFVDITSPLELQLAFAFVEGCKSVGLGIIVNSCDDLTPGNEDIVCFYGFKSDVRRYAEASGTPWLFFGPPYTRHDKSLVRVAVCSHQPYLYVADVGMRVSGSVRAPRLMERDANNSGDILICGASDTFHEFIGMGTAKEYWARRVITDLRTQGFENRIVYRGKPGDVGEVDLNGLDVIVSDHDSIESAMNDASFMVVDSSNTCVDALIHDVPCIVLGEGVTRCISDTEISCKYPYRPTRSQRHNLLDRIYRTELPIDTLDGQGFEHVLEQLRLSRHTWGLVFPAEA